MFRKVKRGQVYRAVRDIKMLGMVILKAAGSGGFYCIVPKDTKIVITQDPWPWPISKGAYAAPLNYKELEAKIVPLKERELFNYGLYALCLDFKDLQYFVKEEVKEIKFDDERMQKNWNEAPSP
jgi:hypothetical protein